jgi:hypothetical protein
MVNLRHPRHYYKLSARVYFSCSKLLRESAFLRLGAQGSKVSQPYFLLPLKLEPKTSTKRTTRRNHEQNN